MSHELDDGEMYGFIASLAMTALITKNDKESILLGYEEYAGKIAKRAVLFADALLVELDKRNPSSERID